MSFFLRNILYKIIIFVNNSALTDFPLIIMSWKQFMKNNAIIFVFKNSYWLIIFTNDSISPFSIWRLPLGIMIKTLSERGTNMKISLLPNKSYNTTIWVCLSINAFKQIELLKFNRGQKNPSSLFQTQKKTPRSEKVCILNVIITTFF